MENTIPVGKNNTFYILGEKIDQYVDLRRMGGMESSHYFSPKQACYLLGLDWGYEKRKLFSHPLFSSSLVLGKVNYGNHLAEQLDLLPVKMKFAWLFIIGHCSDYETDESLFCFQEQVLSLVYSQYQDVQKLSEMLLQHTLKTKDD